MNEEFVPYGKQWIDDDDVKAVMDVLRSDYLTQGPKVPELEAQLRALTGAEYCAVVANATAALHLIVASLSLPRGSEGITTPNTFVASANCLVYNGVRPIFVDIEEKTYNIDPSEIKKKVTNETQVSVAVDFAGQPAALEEIRTIVGKKKITVIEDASHAIGSRYRDGSFVGHCTHSDATVFSFHPVKTATTGEGGAVTTNDKALYEKICLLRSHGITRSFSPGFSSPGPWYYEMTALGYNYRLTDLQAALGCSQLKKLPLLARRRREIVNRYNDEFSDIPWLITPFEAAGTDSCFHLYVLQMDFERVKKTRVQVMEELRKKGIGTQVHYIPVHTQPYYRSTFGTGWGDCPIAEKYYHHALSIPLFPRMTDAEVVRVINAVKGIAD